MGYKSKFKMPTESAMEHFSGWSVMNRETGKRVTTKARLYSVLNLRILLSAILRVISVMPIGRGYG